MKKIEQLRTQRDLIAINMDKLTEILQQFKRPIHILLKEKGDKDLESMSIAEKMNISNLLITMFEEVEKE